MMGINRNELYSYRKMETNYPLTPEQDAVYQKLLEISSRILENRCTEKDVGEIRELVEKADGLCASHGIILKNRHGPHAADPENDIRIRNTGLRLLRKAAIDPETSVDLVDRIFETFAALATDHPSTMNHGIRRQMRNFLGGQGVPEDLRGRAENLILGMDRREKRYGKAVISDSKLAITHMAHSSTAQAKKGKTTSQKANL